MAQLRSAGETGAGPAHVLAGNQQAVVAFGRHQGLQLLGGQRQLLGRAGGGWKRPAGQGRIELAHQPGGAHGAPPHHHPVGAGDRQAAQGIGGAVHIAVGDHGDGEGPLHRRDGTPVGAALEALCAAAAVQGEQLGAGGLELLAPGHGPLGGVAVACLAAPAQPRLHGHRNGHGRGHGVHDAGRQLGVADQTAATAFFGDLLHRAAHVDVDQEGAGCLGAPGGFGHGGGPVVKQLHADRTGFSGELLHLLQPEAQLQAGGVHHLGEQQRIGGPAPHQAPKDAIAHPRQGRLQHPAAQGARRAPAGQLQKRVRSKRHARLSRCNPSHLEQRQ